MKERTHPMRTWSVTVMAAVTAFLMAGPVVVAQDLPDEELVSVVTVVYPPPDPDGIARTVEDVLAEFATISESCTEAMEACSDACGDAGMESFECTETVKKRKVKGAGWCKWGWCGAEFEYYSETEESSIKCVCK